MNLGIGTEATQFLFQEYVNSIFGTMQTSILSRFLLPLKNLYKSKVLYFYFYIVFGGAFLILQTFFVIFFHFQFRKFFFLQFLLAYSLPVFDVLITRNSLHKCTNPYSLKPILFFQIGFKKMIDTAGESMNGWPYSLSCFFY
jgi:hypothetical protein